MTAASDRFAVNVDANQGLEDSSGLAAGETGASKGTSAADRFAIKPTSGSLDNVKLGGQGQIDPASAEADPFSTGDLPSLPSAEEAKDFVGEMAQFEVEQLYNTVGTAMRFGEGVVKFGAGTLQFGIDSLASTGFIERETADSIAKLTAREIEDLNDHLVRTFGDGPIFQMSEKAGELVPMLVVPQTWGLNKGVSFIKTILQVGSGAVIGGVAGGGVFIDPTEEGSGSVAERQSERQTGVFLGAGLGAAAASVPVFMSAIKGWLSRSVRAQLDSPFTNKAREIDAFMRKELGPEVALSAEQLVDSASIRAITNLARGSSTVEDAARGLQKRQLEGVHKLFLAESDRLSRTKEFGKNVQDAFNKTHDIFKRNRTDNANTNFNVVKEILDDRYGTALIIPTGNVRKVMQAEMDDLGRYAFLGDQERKFHNEIGAITDELGSLGLVTVKDIKAQLTKWGKMASGDANPFKDSLSPSQARAFGTAMHRGWLADLDQAIAAGAEGAEALAFARNAYKADTAAIQSLKDTAVGSFFASTKLKTSGDIEAKFTKLANSDQKALKDSMDMLGEHSPELRDQLQSFWIESFLSKSTDFAPLNESEIVISALGKMSTGKNRAAYETIFDTPAKLKRMNKLADAVRAISTGNASATGSFPTMLRAAAGVGVSRDPTFAARLASDLFMPKALSKYAFNDDAIKALNDLSKPFNQNKWAGAISILSKIAGILPMNDTELIESGYAVEADGNTLIRQQPDVFSPEERESNVTNIQQGISLGQ